MKLTAKKFPFLEDYRLPHGYNIVKRKRKLGDENFHIVTLGDRVVLGDNILVSILDYGIDQLFNLFSPNTPLTAAHVAKAYPGNGIWHDRMRAKILRHNSWISDVTNPDANHFNIIMQELVHENLYQLSDGKYPNLFTGQWQAGDNFQKYVNVFWEKISQENNQSGNVIGYSGGDFSLNKIFAGGSETTNIILIGAAIGLLFAMMNKRKKR